VLFLGAYAWPILQPTLSHSLRELCTAIVYVSWAMFAVDYVGRLALAERKRTFVWHNLLDLASIALPVLRPLRLLRLVALIRVLNRKATPSLQGRVAIYVGSTVVLIVFVAALAVLDAERGKPHANINSFGDALWWSVTTVMTVGYGDRYPVTLGGRFVAVGLMLGGIALLGVVTASIASWLIGRVRDAEATAEARLNRHIEELRSEIAELKALVVGSRFTTDTSETPGP
jgi:voltage-gated potassium channel